MSKQPKPTHVEPLLLLLWNRFVGLSSNLKQAKKRLMVFKSFKARNGLEIPNAKNLKDMIVIMAR